jgi:hypothetical protein
MSLRRALRDRRLISRDSLPKIGPDVSAFKGSTLSGEASKQTSSPILDRPMRILDSGRSELEGTVASNSAVTEDGAI